MNAKNGKDNSRTRSARDILFLGAAGFLLFMVAYLGVTFALFYVFHGNSCNISLPAVRVAILVTAPLNFCEALSPQYGGLLGGLLSNGYAIAIMIFLAVICQEVYGNTLRRYLDFERVFVVAVASTYALSLAASLSGTNGAGTSIIGADALLYMLLVFVSGLAVGLLHRNRVRLSSGKIYFGYAVPIILIGFLLFMTYLAVPDPLPHIEGGILLLVYLSINAAVVLKRQRRNSRTMNRNKR